MPDPSPYLPLAATRFLGDLHPLTDCLGGPDGLSSLAPAAAFLSAQNIRRRDELLDFLLRYQSQVLFSHELKAIASAYQHINRSEVRELILLDQSLSAEPALASFAAPSQFLGGLQLKRLRPLKDQRSVQRYLRAVENGIARGWHTLVFGLILSVYSLPLRQGLIDYSHHTLNGFLKSPAGFFHLDKPEFQKLFKDFRAGLSSAVDGILASPAPSEWR